MTTSSRGTAVFAAGLMAALALMAPLDARQAAAGACRISGKATSGSTPLPGVALTIKTADAVKGATSTELDGGYAINLPPGSYTLVAELTGFGKVERPVVVDDAKCAQTVDLSLTLAPRQSLASRPTQQTTAAATGGRGGLQPAGRGGRGAQFETLQVRPQAEQAAALASSEREPEDAGTRLLLPPGFSTEAPTEAIAISGNTASIDRGMLNDRFEAIGRGVFDP